MLTNDGNSIACLTSQAYLILLNLKSVISQSSNLFLFVSNIYTTVSIITAKAPHQLDKQVEEEKERLGLLNANKKENKHYSNSFYRCLFSSTALIHKAFLFILDRSLSPYVSIALLVLSIIGLATGGVGFASFLPAYMGYIGIGLITAATSLKAVHFYSTAEYNMGLKIAFELSRGLALSNGLENSLVFAKAHKALNDGEAKILKEYFKDKALKRNIISMTCNLLANLLDFVTGVLCSTTGHAVSAITLLIFSTTAFLSGIFNNNQEHISRVSLEARVTNNLKVIGDAPEQLIYDQLERLAPRMVISSPSKDFTIIRPKDVEKYKADIKNYLATQQVSDAERKELLNFANLLTWNPYKIISNAIMSSYVKPRTEEEEKTVNTVNKFLSSSAIWLAITNGYSYHAMTKIYDTRERLDGRGVTSNDTFSDISQQIFSMTGRRSALR